MKQDILSTRRSSNPYGSGTSGYLIRHSHILRQDVNKVISARALVVNLLPAKKAHPQFPIYLKYISSHRV